MNYTHELARIFSAFMNYNEGSRVTTISEVENHLAEFFTKNPEVLDWLIQEIDQGQTIGAIKWFCHCAEAIASPK